MMAYPHMLDVILCILLLATVLGQGSNVSWTQISIIGGDLLSTRKLHTAVLSPAGRMWVFAGRDDKVSYQFLSDTWYIDLQAASHSWTQVLTGNSPSARGRHSAVLAPTGKLWIHGGTDNTNSLLSDLWYLQTENLTSPTWTELAAGSSSERKDHSAVITASGRMYICFGGISSGQTNSLRYIDLEDSSPSWIDVNPCCNTPPGVRWNRGAVLSDAGRMWVFGGLGWSSGPFYHNDLWWIDLEDGTPNWNEVSVTGNVPPSRVDSVAVLTSTGRFWLFGGSDSEGNVENDLWYIDVEAPSPTWTQSFEINGRPNGVSSHTAVLLDDHQMWIFGGSDGTFSLDELWYAEVPSPAFNQTTFSGAPSRYLHTVVLAPSGRMWMFGGHDFSDHNDLWYSDTKADTHAFTEASPSGSPPAEVKRHTAVLSSEGNMWVFGGELSDGGLVNTLHKIDVDTAETPTWMQVYPSGSIEARRDHTAVITSNDRMWIFAGVQSDYGRRNDLVYIDVEDDNPSYTTAATSGSLPRGRGLPRVVLNTTSNRMWMFGGYSNEELWENDLWFVDLHNGTLTWNEVFPSVSPSPRVDMAGELSSDGRFWIYGGADSSGPLSDLWFILLEAPGWALTWQPVDPVTVLGNPGARQYHSAVITSSGDMLIYGGKDNSGTFSDMWSLSPVGPAITALDAEWSQVSPSDPPDGRVYSSTVMSPDGRMLLVHGYKDDPSYTSVADLVYIDTQVWPSSLAWINVSQPGPTIPSARSGHSSILTETGRVYIYGGTDSPGNPSSYSDLWYFDTEASSVEWVQMSVTSTTSRRYHGAAYSSGRMYMFGGATGSGTLLNDVGYIDLTMSGSTWWTDVAVTGTPPSVRYKHCAVMSSVRRMWVFGGQSDMTGSSFLNDLWYIDVEEASTSWYEVSVPGVVPTARSDHTGVLSATGRMWIYGGTSAFGVLGDVWYIDVEVSPPSWVRVIASGSNPGARMAHSAALTADNEMWVFSGYDSSGDVDNELWFLEAASPAWIPIDEWTTARYDHSSVMTASGRAVVFGGYTGTLGLNDLRAYDTQASSSSWYEISTCCPPTARWSHTAVITSTGRMWIFGGWDGSSNYNDLWYVDVEDPSPAWAQASPSGNIAARSEHVAVISAAGRMWVFGGRDISGGSRLNDLYYIDLESGSPEWVQAMASGVAPSARGKPSAGMNDAGLYMVIFGGWADSGGLQDDLHYLDLQDQTMPTWYQVSTSRKPPARADAAAVLTNELRFWPFGGNGVCQQRIDDVWFINLQAATPNWVEVSPISTSGSPSARQFHSALLTRQGDIFLSGGKTGAGVATDVWYLVGVAANATASTTASTTRSTSTSTTTTAIIVSLRWTEVFPSGGMPTARTYHSANVDESGKMWMYGGWHLGGGLDDTWYIDLQDSMPMWTQLYPNSTPGGRTRHASFLDETGRMWIHGGFDSSLTIVGSLWMLDTQASAPNWTEMTDGLPRLRDHSAVITNTSQVYMHGGYGGIGYCCERSSLYTFNLQDVQSYSDMSGSISGSSPGNRHMHIAVLSTSNRMWIFGGLQAGSKMNDLRFVDLDEASPSWIEVSPTGELPAARDGHSGILTNTERLWIYGGTDTTNNFLNDIWFIDLQDISNTPFWMEVSAQNAPSARNRHSAVFSSMSEMWVFGGANNDGYRNDLWLLEASSPSWSQIAYKCCSTPNPRINHRAVFSSDQLMWIFAGWDEVSISLVNELWYLDFQEDPPGWYQKNPSTSPSQRVEHSAALSGTNQLWIYGGVTNGNSVLSDLWYIDLPAASSWVQMHPSGSGGSRKGHSAVFTAQGTMWIFAGNDGASDLSDVMLIDLEATSPTWMTTSVMSSTPTARSRHQAVLRHHTNKMWIYGGYTSSGDFFHYDLWSVELADPENLYWQQSFPSESPPVRADCSAVLTSTGRLWIWGGVNSGGVLKDLWVIDVDAYTPTWSEIYAVTSAAGGPAGRNMQSTVITPQGDMLIFGGSTAPLSGTPSAVNNAWRLSSVGVPSTGSTTTTTTSTRVRSTSTSRSSSTSTSSSSSSSSSTNISGIGTTATVTSATNATTTSSTTSTLTWTSTSLTSTTTTLHALATNTTTTNHFNVSINIDYKDSHDLHISHHIDGKLFDCHSWCVFACHEYDHHWHYHHSLGDEH